LEAWIRDLACSKSFLRPDNETPDSDEGTVVLCRSRLVTISINFRNSTKIPPGSDMLGRVTSFDVGIAKFVVEANVLAI
jgi:hypothetical protein